jgi:hypothetical protein
LHQPLAEGKGTAVRQGLEEAGSKTAVRGTQSMYEAIQVRRVGTKQRSLKQSRTWGVNKPDAQRKSTFLPGETCYQAERQPCLRKQAEVTGVSRSHSTEGKKSREGLNNEKDEYSEQFEE